MAEVEHRHQTRPGSVSDQTDLSFPPVKVEVEQEEQDLTRPTAGSSALAEVRAQPGL